MSSSENRRHVRGTDFLRNKDRITIVMSVNADGTHVLPVWYIGHAANSRCFRDSRYTALRSLYSNQSNAWMDTKEYNTWLQWWFHEVRKVTQEDVQLIIDNFGSHGVGLNLPGLRVESLTLKLTHKYQPLDLEIISNAKISYRTVMLRAIIDITIRWNTGEHDFPLNSQHGQWGVNNGYLPHVADAMTMFNKAWSKLLPSSVVNCWSKSQFLSMIQVAQAREIICKLNAGSEESSATSVLNQYVAEEIYNDICALNFQTQVENPLGEIMPPHTNISNDSEIAESLSTFSVTGVEINRHDIASKD